MNPNIEKRIQELEKWKAEREKQQIRFPIDQQSLIVLSKYFLSRVGQIEYTNASGDPFRNILVSQDNKLDVVSVFAEMVRFRASTSDVITLGQNIVTGAMVTDFADTQQVFVLAASGADSVLPSPLNDTTIYYVRDSTGSTFKLATSSGGSAINLTTAGSGDLYIYRI
jgi:hypothetical protein